MYRKELGYDRDGMVLAVVACFVLCSVTDQHNMQDFRNLDVWHKAHELAIDVHKTLVRHRRVDAHLRSQLSRAARSIPANLVEGCGKESQADLARYADTSIASSSEVEYWVLLAKDVGYFPQSDFERLTAKTIEVRKMLFGLRRAIRHSIRKESEAQPETSLTI